MEGKWLEWGSYSEYPFPRKYSYFEDGHGDSQTTSDLLKLFMAMQFSSAGMDGIWMVYTLYSR